MTEGDKEFIHSVNVWLDGWKGLAGYYNKSIRTLQRWHRVIPIPWEKNGPKKRDSVRIHVKVADAYFNLRSSLDHQKK